MTHPWRTEDRHTAIVARSLWQALGSPVPVDVRAAAAHLGATIALRHGASDLFRAAVVLPERRIVVNAGIGLLRQRYAVAHELGELLVHDGVIEVRPHRRERICQLFAAHLLLPPDVLRAEVAARHGSHRMLEGLVTRFGVSAEPICIQLRRMRLLPGCPDWETVEAFVDGVGWADAALGADLGVVVAPASTSAVQPGDFGRAVECELLRRGISRREAARLAQVPVRRVDAMCAGHVPTLDALVRFAERVGADVGRLLSVAGHAAVMVATG